MKEHTNIFNSVDAFRKMYWHPSGVRLYWTHLDAEPSRCRRVRDDHPVPNTAVSM